MHHAFFARQNFNEAAHRNDARHPADINTADLDALYQPDDPVTSRFTARLIDAADENLAVVFDIDRRSGLLNDAADHFASRSYNCADIFGIDVDLDNARSPMVTFLCAVWAARLPSCR